MFRKKFIVIIMLSIILTITNMITLGAADDSRKNIYAASSSTSSSLKVPSMEQRILTLSSTHYSKGPSVHFSPVTTSMPAFFDKNVKSESKELESESKELENEIDATQTIISDEVPQESLSTENATLETQSQINSDNSITKEVQESSVTPVSNIINGYEYTQCYDVVWTAYCLCEGCCGKTPDDPGYGITASGYKITPGIGEKVIAVDPNLIPLGSYVYVEIDGIDDYGYALAADTGGAIKNNKIDLYIDGHCGPWYGKGNAKLYIISTP